MTQQPFNPQSYIQKIDTSAGKKDYLPLQGRLLWFTGEVSEYVIETEIILLDLDKEVTVERMAWSEEAHRKVPVSKTAKGIAVYHATLAIYKDGNLVKKVPGDKMETAVDFPDFLEKAQSGAIGRCLMFAGYGTAFAIELDESERLCDTPLARTQEQSSAATPAQHQSIVNLCKIIGKPQPTDLDNLTFDQAKELITKLGREKNGHSSNHSH